MHEEHDGERREKTEDVQVTSKRVEEPACHATQRFTL